FAPAALPVAADATPLRRLPQTKTAPDGTSAAGGRGLTQRRRPGENSGGWAERKVQPHRAASATSNSEKPERRPGVGCNGLFGPPPLFSISNSRCPLFRLFRPFSAPVQTALSGFSQDQIDRPATASMRPWLSAVNP